MASDPLATDDLNSRLLAAHAELERRLRAGLLGGAEDLRDAYPDLWADPAAAGELAFAEYVLRANGGENPSRDDWYRRFPQLRERLERLFAIRGLTAAGPGPGEQGRSTLDDDPRSGPAEPPPDLRLPGYELLGAIGAGGMGVVYKARQVALNRIVAVKMLHPGPLIRAADAGRFRREAEAVARLQHPYIVQIHEVGDAGGVPFLCLEYVPGGSLDDALARAKRPGQDGVTPEGAARLVEALARAMHYAHGQGVVHRDLKPANVLLAEDGTPKVADFGLATLAEAPGAATRTGAVLGTPQYMAPEQANADKTLVGPRTDIYALGGILYQMLTGRPPFEGATVLDTLELVRGAEPVPPRRLRPKVPRDLETVCLKCLQKEPGKRYPTAEALADDLGRFLGGKPVRARPISALERGAKWARRRPAVAALAVAVLVLLGASVGLLGAKYAADENAHRTEQGRLWDQYVAAEQARETEQRQRLELEKTLAGERIARAQAHYNANERELAKQLLGEVEERYRDAHWLALHRECHAELASHRIPGNYVGRLVPSPDGARLALYRPDPPGALGVLIFDARAAEFSSVPLRARVRAAAFTRDRGLVVALPNLSPTSVDQSTPAPKRETSDRCLVWDPSMRKAVSEWKLGTTAVPVLTGDGLRVVAAFGNQIRILDSLTGAPIAELPAEGERRLSGRLVADQCGRRLAFFQLKEIRIWDVGAQRVTHTIPADSPPGPGFFSPDDELLVWLTIPPGDRSAGKLVPRLVGWDLSRGEERFRINGANVSNGCVAFSPDGRLLAFPESVGVGLHETRSGARVASLRGHAGPVSDVAFSPDGSRLYSVAHDLQLKTWNVRPWSLQQ